MSQLFRIIVENSKRKYKVQYLKRIQSFTQSHEWPYMARRAIVYAIVKHTNTSDLPLYFVTNREFIQSLANCLNNGDVDIPCLEQCLADIMCGRRTFCMHSTLLSEK